MAHPSVVAAVDARLAANWSACPIRKVNDSESPPPDGAAYIEAQFPVAADRQTSLGATYRERGGVRFVIATKRGSGLAQSKDWCRQISALFRNQRLDGVEFRMTTVRQGYAEGAYFVATVVVDYEFNHLD